MIRTIIFDIGNVLTDFRWEGFFEDLGYSKELIDKIGKATVKSSCWCEFDRGTISDEELLKQFIENDPSIERELRESLYNIKGMVTKRDYAIPWIKELKSKGYQVLVLSNFSRKAEVECADALDFMPFVDGGILSYKDKVIKPNPKIYDLLIKRYSLKPEECVFLDDLQENIDAAKEFGMHGIVFTTQEEAKKELVQLGVI